MSVQPQTIEQQGACVRLVALYRNARQPIRRLTNVLTLLGRGDNCDIILSSASVGVAHAAIVRLGTTAYVCDLGAPGGTQLDGRPVRWSRMRDTAELVLGRFRFRVELEGGEAALAAESPAFSLLRDGEVIATTVEEPLLLIGSADGCDVLAQEEGVAGRHALIVWTHHGPILRDLSTQTGTRHNGRRIVVARLMAGDTVGVGAHELTFQIDMRHLSAAGLEALESGVVASSSAAIDSLISARLGDEQNTEIDDLLPPAPLRLDEKTLRAETQRDLSLLNDASRSLSDSTARLESSFDGSAIMAGLDHATVGAEQAVLMSARGSGAGESKSSDRDAGDRARDGLLESTMRLQSRRDEDKRRGYKPGLRDESAAGVSAAPPWVEGVEGPGTQTERPPGPAGDHGPINEAQRTDPAAPQSRGGAEDAVREMVWQKTAGRLEMELAEAREELKRVKSKYAQYMEVHGTVEARNRKLDQRIADLRARVAGAQEALDERARSLRTSLEAERERLRLQHIDIQRKSDELEGVASRQKSEVQQTFEGERATLEQARAELRAERDALANLRAEFEARVQRTQVEQDQVLAETSTAFKTRLAELDERQREIEKAAAEDNERREAAFAWRENELAERRRALELEAESAARQREAELAGREEELAAQRLALQREAEQAAREHEAEISRQNAELNEQRVALQREAARAAQEREEEVARQEEQLSARRAALQREVEQAARKREEELARREAELDAGREALQQEIATAARQREDEIARHREELAASRQTSEAEAQAASRAFVEELERREAELRTREGKLDARQREASAAIERSRQADEETFVARQQALEQAFRLRVKEFEDRCAQRDKEIDKRREELERQANELAAQREAEMQARLREMEAGLAEIDAKRIEEHRERESVVEQRRVAARSVLERQIAERETEFRKREAEFIGRERQIEDRMRELEEAAKLAARQADEQLELRRKELDESARVEFGRREADFVRREREIQERLRELDEASRQAARWADEHLDTRRKEFETFAEAELNRRHAELEQAMNARLADGELELAARDSEHRSKLEALTQRESEMNRIAEHFRGRETQLEQRHSALDGREQELLRKVDRHAQRESELTQLAATFESRNARLVEWQTRLESEQTILDAERDEAEKSRAAILARQQEIDQRAAELEASFAELLSGHTGLRTERELLDGHAAEFGLREVQLRRREEALERSREELAEDERRVNDAREQVRELDDKLKLLDQRGSELTALSETLSERERLLAERVTSHEEQVGAFERGRSEVDELRVRLDADRREQEAKARKLDERMARAEIADQRSREAKLRLDQERGELEELRSATAARSESIDEQSRDLMRRTATLETELAATRAERERLAERDRELDREKAETAAAKDGVAAERTALELLQTRLNEQKAAFVRDQAALEKKASALEAERARLERDKLLHRDRDRDLSGDRVALGEAEQELERLQAELKKGIDENHVQKRQLQETRERLRSRKARLLQDAAKIDDRQHQLDAEVEQTRKLRSKLDADREALVEERRKLEVERDSHREQGQGLDQAQRTFQAGLREVEAREKVAAARELELAEHARKLEEYRTRLEEEYGDIEQQRKQLLDAQEKGGAETQRITVLMDQAEAQRTELRAREEKLGSLEKALAARAAEVGKAEEDTRQKLAEFDDRLSRIEDARRQLERDRTALTESIETQRDDVETLKRQAEADIAAQHAELERRMRVFEADMAAQREALESEERVRDNAFAEELRRKVEAEMTERLAAARQQEEEIERRCKSRLEEVERDIHDRLARFEEDIHRRRAGVEESLSSQTSEASEQSRAAQSRLEAQLEDLRARHEALARDHTRIKEQRDALDAQRREFEAQRREFAAQKARDEENKIDHDGLESAAEARRRELDEREREIEERAAELKASEAALERSRTAGDSDTRSIGSTFVDDPEESDWEGVDQVAVPASASAGGLEFQRHAESTPALNGPRRKSIAGPAVVAIALGLVFSTIVYKLLPPGPQFGGPRFAQAFVKLDSSAPSSMIDLSKHCVAIRDSLKDASRISNADLVGQFQARKIEIEADEARGGIRLRAQMSDPGSTKEIAWLNAIAQAYQTTLKKASESQKEIDGRLAEITLQRQEKRAQIEAEGRKLAEFQKALDADPQVAEVERTQEQLKHELDAANQAAGEARTALESAQAKPVSDAPITPSETQRKAAYAQDPELAQAMEQRAMFARDFHAQLVKGVDASAAPLSNLLNAIEDFRAQIDDQRKDQKGREILAQIEQVAVGVSDLRDLTQKFTDSMAELSPKVKKWTDGADPEMLLEYQADAEDLIRKFFANSNSTINQIRKDIGEIGSGGSEPTQRNIIQRGLEKSVYDTAVAIRDLVNEAVALVRANNKELLTFQRGMSDLTRNIKQKQEQHEDALVKHLRATQSDERAAAIAKLRSDLEEAVKRKDAATTAFVNRVEQAIQNDRAASERVRNLRKQYDEQNIRLRTLERELAQMDSESLQIERDGHTGLAGVSTCQVESNGTPKTSGLDRARVSTAGGVGGLAALLFFSSFWLMSPRPRRS